MLGASMEIFCLLLLRSRQHLMDISIDVTKILILTTFI